MNTTSGRNCSLVGVAEVQRIVEYLDYIKEALNAHIRSFFRIVPFLTKIKTYKYDLNASSIMITISSTASQHKLTKHTQVDSK